MINVSILIEFYKKRAIPSARLKHRSILFINTLQGGQLVFVLVEGIIGKKIDERTQEAINTAAIFLLLFVTFSTTAGDLTALVSSKQR